jgi:3',5'-cyclic AMP phosphodiesterase CpdA
MRTIILYILGILFLKFNSHAQINKIEDFNFVFMTDIHLAHDKGAPEGFQMAIDTANNLNADFVLTGGDLVADALGTAHKDAESFYTLYMEMIKGFEMPVYNTIGNHELFGLYKESGVDSTHPDYNKKMYERFLGDTYYSFDHKGWHFIIISSAADRGNEYIGLIDQEQIDWIKSDLNKLDKKTPIIVSTHIPLITTFGQIKHGSLSPNDSGLVVNNGQEVLMLFREYNLKLILQGHLHIVESIEYHTGIKLLVGGAVSARWWNGPNMGMEEGFMLLKIREEEVDWEYIDYGWDAPKLRQIGYNVTRKLNRIFSN